MSDIPYTVNGLFDSFIDDLLSKNMDVAISWWLMGSYVYYRLNKSLMSDSMFDRLNLIIKENYETIEHNHKHLITMDRLSVGSGFDIKEYPLIVKSASMGLLLKMES